MYRTIGVAALVGVFAAASPAWSQSLARGVRSQTRFAGTVTVSVNGKPRPVPVTARTWAMAPGARIDDVRDGRGNLVVAVQSGVLIASFGGHERTEPGGSFFTVPANEKVTLTTPHDRSTVFRTLLLPPG